MDRNPSISILEAEGEHSDVPPHHMEDRLDGPHLEPHRGTKQLRSGRFTTVLHKPVAIHTTNRLQTRPVPRKSRTELPQGKPFPRWRMGNNTEEGAEPLTAEKVTRMGHGTPTSTPLPPKVSPPCPIRWTSGGTDSSLP